MVTWFLKGKCYILLIMILEDKTYVSNVLKTFGFAFFTPIGSVFFQPLLFKKSIFEGYFSLTLFAMLIGIAFLYIGYNVIKVRKNQ